MNKCLGCGIELQNQNTDSLGYTKNLNGKYCERCFRIKHYHDYKLVDIKNEKYIDILKEIGKTNNLVILVVDLFNINKNLDIIGKYIKNNILLVLTKRDLLPLSIYDNNILNYFKKYNLNIIDQVIISSKNNYNYDELYNMILKYKTADIYVVGFTNAGKSTMINKLIYNYSTLESSIITSFLPSTTLNTIEIKFDDFKLIDTPGLLDEGNIINYIDINKYKYIIPSKEIKPITYQIKVDQVIILDELLRVDVSSYNSLTFYMSNDISYYRTYKKTDKLSNLKKHVINVNDNSDIVINGLGFIKIVKKGKFVIYTIDGIEVFVRNSLI